MSESTDKQTIIEAVTRFFHAVDAGDWASARDLLTDPVEIAHGAQQMTLSSKDLASGWEASHARFATTRYELQPVGIERTGGDRATARFSSRATFTPAEPAQQPALVIDGHYTVDLERSASTWSIRSIRHDEARSRSTH
jgi:ketosteroid isomerase-like protein